MFPAAYLQATWIDPSKQEITHLETVAINIANYSFMPHIALIWLMRQLTSHPGLRQELYWAQKLGFTHIITPTRSFSFFLFEGIDALACSGTQSHNKNCPRYFCIGKCRFYSPVNRRFAWYLQLIRSKLDEPAASSAFVLTRPQRPMLLATILQTEKLGVRNIFNY